MPLSIRVAKVNVPDALIGRSAPPPFCNTRPEPESPVTVPPTVYVAGGGGPESPAPHAVSAARIGAAKPHRVMLRIRDFILIRSLVIDANGAAHCARAATAGEHCTQMHSNPSSTWIDRVVCCHLGICRAKAHPLHECLPKIPS